jgi:PadR family transcriptional regulator
MLLLAVLRLGPRHGYAVINELRDRSGGTFDLPEGTVYPALHKLERAGLVASEWTTVDGRRRRLYALTSPGATALAEQTEDWQRVVRSVAAVIAP